MNKRDYSGEVDEGEATARPTNASIFRHGGDSRPDCVSQWLADLAAVRVQFPDKICAFIECKKGTIDLGCPVCKGHASAFGVWWKSKAVHSDFPSKTIAMIAFLQFVTADVKCKVHICELTPATVNETRPFQPAPDGSKDALCPTHWTSLNSFCSYRKWDHKYGYPIWLNAIDAALAENPTIYLKLGSFIPSECCVKSCPIRWPRDRKISQRNKFPGLDGYCCSFDYQKFWRTLGYTNQSLPKREEITEEHVRAFKKETYVVNVEKREAACRKLASTRALVDEARKTGNILCRGKCPRETIRGRVGAIIPWGSETRILVCATCYGRIRHNNKDWSPSDMAKYKATLAELGEEHDDGYSDARKDCFNDFFVLTILECWLQKKWIRCRVSGEYHTATTGAHLEYRVDGDHRWWGIRDLCAHWVNAAKIAPDALVEEMGGDRAKAQERFLSLVLPGLLPLSEMHPSLRPLALTWETHLKDFQKGRRITESIPGFWDLFHHYALVDFYRAKLNRALPPKLDFHHSYVDGAPKDMIKPPINKSSGWTERYGRALAGNSGTHDKKTYLQLYEGYIRTWVPRLMDSLDAYDPLSAVLRAVNADAECKPIIMEAERKHSKGMDYFEESDVVASIIEKKSELHGLVEVLFSDKCWDVHPMTGEDFQRIVVENAPANDSHPVIPAQVRVGREDREPCQYGSWHGMIPAEYRLPEWVIGVDGLVDEEEDGILDLDTLEDVDGDDN
ncbi:hypothetical protein B0H13DRAFT_2541468 [Mycena leptocephala]|nr:hypothetical protein B0H13DRAFT_2541468 [Mycena leptocephala]